MEKKTRTPRNAETITKGALALTLFERAALRDELVKSINNEVATLKLQAEQAAHLLVS